MGNIESARDLGQGVYTQAQTDSLLATKEPADATILKQADIGTSVLAPNGDGSNLSGVGKLIGYAESNQITTFLTISSSSYVDIDPSLSITYTPKSSNSTIIVSANLNVDTDVHRVTLAFFKDGSKITTNPSNADAMFNNLGGIAAHTQVEVKTSFNNQSTTASTYTIRGLANNGSFTINNDWGTCKMYITEIAN